MPVITFNRFFRSLRRSEDRGAGRQFEVTSPFGLESVQIIASEKDLAIIPDHRLDGCTGLYIVASRAAEGIVKTRALKPKPMPDNGSAETVLVFTTSL